ncbi:histone-lysine N-methyltransferase SETMAR, partial [Cryptotermes secundus]|uniref:histone-lysine N-methyltransferase SETMAR n=1 Tax=Cryptotermes secundus TaxID=105785 RepID=UPI000CD7BDF4
MLSAGTLFLHDNTRPHTARWTVSLLQEFSWEVFNHQPYSPDLAPSDFHLFLHLKKFLSGEHQLFENDREAEMVVTWWFQSQAADFYNTTISKTAHIISGKPETFEDDPELSPNDLTYFNYAPVTSCDVEQ